MRAAVRDEWIRLLSGGARSTSLATGRGISDGALQPQSRALLPTRLIQVGDHVRRRADRGGQQHRTAMKVDAIDDVMATCMWLDEYGKLHEGNFRPHWLEMVAQLSD
jgi:hypothetical protein